MHRPNLLRVALAAFLAAWLSLAVLAYSARADGHQGGDFGRWVALSPPKGIDGLARVSFYGPQYGAGDVCMSGVPYRPDAELCALGPSMLREARELTGCEWPIVRLTIPGRSDRLYVPVLDSGSSIDGVELEVDLPDEIWLAWSGLPPGAGLFGARAEVWVSNTQVVPPEYY